MRLKLTWLLGNKATIGETTTLVKLYKAMLSTDKILLATRRVLEGAGKEGKKCGSILFIFLLFCIHIFDDLLDISPYQVCHFHPAYLEYSKIVDIDL